MLARGGQFRAGTKHNIIPAEARLSPNLRTQDARVRDRVLGAVRRIVEGECRTAGCPTLPEVTVRPGYPNTVNDTVLDGESSAVHRELFGPPTVLDFGPAMGSEDFFPPRARGRALRLLVRDVDPARGVGRGPRCAITRPLP
ncbi:hypothetical protein [Streptomyces sp. NBC_01257]|uniref:hypothetical protein n=1 Tax=Streptomyces sp. NBC_01257 TaxID=2903799 RepID=UPI002DDA7C38|nr:hypothetical protein [Streptomyces sp. NBC_01257]WRZ67922.1 hypothetical protein OG408_30345 [Streptomyces sp. NBC_01257]